MNFAPLTQLYLKAGAQTLQHDLLARAHACRVRFLLLAAQRGLSLNPTWKVS